MALQQALKVNVDSLGDLQYAGFSGGFVQLKGSEFGRGALRLQVTNSSVSEFNLFDPVRVVDAQIVRSDINDNGRGNAGLLRGELVKADSDKKSTWADKKSGEYHVEFSSHLYTIPDNEYLPDTFKYVSEEIGATPEVERLRQSFVRQGNTREDAETTYPDNALKVRVADPVTSEIYVVDLPIEQQTALSSTFNFGDDVKFTNLIIRFFSPTKGRFNHLLSADDVVFAKAADSAVTKQTSNGGNASNNTNNNKKSDSEAKENK